MDIVEELRQDPENGAKLLESEYKKRLMQVACRLCTDESEAEALVWKTISEAVRNIDSYVERDAFFSWLCKILVNCHGHDTRRKSVSQVEYREEIPEIEDGSPTADRIYAEIDSGFLRDEIVRLPPDMKEVIILRYLMDQPIAKIAKVLSLPIGTVHSRLHYARKVLGERLGMVRGKAVALMAVAGVLSFVSFAAWVAGELLSESIPQPTPSSEKEISKEIKGKEENAVNTNIIKSVIAVTALGGSALANGAELPMPVLLGTTVLADDGVYVNDLSTRISKGTVPSAEWRELVYPAPGTRIYHNYQGTREWTYSPEKPWLQSTNRVDGWIAGGYANNWCPGWTTRTNTTAMGDSERPYFSGALNSQEYFRGRYLTPIGNSFTNGVLYVQVDIRAPTSWIRGKPSGSSSSVHPMIRVFPAFRSTMNNPDQASDTTGYIGIFGLNGSGDKDGTIVNVVHFVGYGNNDESESLHGTGGGIGATNRHWYRFCARFDLRYGVFKVWSKDMGVSLPAIDDPTVPTDSDNAFYSYQQKFYRPISPENPIEGLGFQMGGISSGNPVDVEKTASFANIRLSWCPDGNDAEKQVFYTNDAVTRRVRRITPEATVCSYGAPSAAVVPSVFAGYEAQPKANIREKHLLTYGSNGDENKPQPVGVDGWRRQNKGGSAIVSVAASDEAGGKMMRISSLVDYGIFTFAMQPLGEPITSGKVRVSVDGRTPDKWYWNNRYLSFQVGSTALYGANHNGYVAQVIAQSQFTSDSDSGTPYLTMKSNGANSKVGVNGKFSTWYRIVTTIDMDAKTYGVKVYELGATSRAASFVPTADQLLYETSGVAFANTGLADVGTLMLGAYGVGYKDKASWASSALFDNIQVWKDADTANEKLVYYNDFDKRVRYNSSEGDDYATAWDRATPEQDGWKAVPLDGTGATIVRTGAANPCLKIAASGQAPAMIQEFGTDLKAEDGKFVMRADLRPPECWEGASFAQGVAAVAFGGSQFVQGNTGAYDPFLDHAAFTFGFDTGGGSYNIVDCITTVRPFATGADGRQPLSFAVDATHWYRFVAKADVNARTYDLKVYDMGTTQPEATTPNGTAVVTLKGLAFAASADADISGSALLVSGTSGNSDTRFAYFDNVSVETKSRGMFILFR